MSKGGRRAELEKRVIGELEDGGRILVSRLQYLGDVVLTLPVVHALKVRFPHATVDYLTKTPGADLLEGEALVGDIHRLPENRQGPGAMLALIGRLRSRRYVAAIDLYSNPRSAMMTWLSGAPLRVGGSRRGRRHFYTHPIDVPRSVRGATEHHMHFVRPLDVPGPPGKPSLVPTEPERRRAREFLAERGLDGAQRLVAVHPGGKWEVKRWPADLFAELIHRLVERHGHRVVVLCGPGEEAYRDAVRSSVGEAAVYAPILPIRSTAALLEAADAVIVCDGGIMHVSVAVGTPTVGIFGSAEPDIWFPYESLGPFIAAHVPITCRPCHQHTCSHISCLRRLTVDRVASTLRAVMARHEQAAT